MKWLRNSGISLKLNVLSSVIVAMALVACATALISAQIYFLWRATQEQTEALAEVVGSSCSAAIEFEDGETAARLLSSLEHKPTVLRAVLYNQRGEVLARYVRHESLTPQEDIRSELWTLNVNREIQRHGELLGRIHITVGSDDLWRQLAAFAAVAALTLGVTLTLTISAGQSVQRQLREPILELARAVKRVTQDHDLSIRVHPSSTDELGLLCDGFNSMLARLEDNREALEAANAELESRVHERTSALQAALAQAEAASAAKTNFLANMSHEIRTPMTAILGYLDFLDEEGVSREQRREYLDTVRRNGKHLLGIINDILDLSKIEAGCMQLERIPCSLRQIAHEVASLMGARATEKGLTLKFEVRGHVPEQIQTDPMRLKQVIVNLISNAIKFTEQGFVELIVEMTDTDSNGARKARFSIRDSGIGMSPEVLKQIFRPFTQADESMTRRFGGTGLGLSISRRLAELLGGNVVAKSAVGVGSEFILEIDPGSLVDVNWVVDDNDSTTRPELIAPPVDVLKLPVGLTILLAEDSLDNQMLISTLLRRRGASVEIAENGQLAVQLAQQRNAAGKPFDVILMDMQMPVMDGYEATRRLRTEGYLGRIVALTAHAMSGDRARCLAAGCDDFATKPIDKKTLFETICRHVQELKQDATEAFS